MRLLITRHGQTEHNVKGIVQGKEEGQVSPYGFRQIDALIPRLQQEDITNILSSNIPRCVTTTEHMNKTLQLPVEFTDLVREKDNGDFVGKDAKQIDWDSLPGTFETRKAPNGESLEDVKGRGQQLLNMLKPKTDTAETLLLVSHGGFLKVFIGHLLGLSLHDSIFKLAIEHCSLSCFNFNSKYKSGYQLEYLNDKKFIEQVEPDVEIEGVVY